MTVVPDRTAAKSAPEIVMELLESLVIDAGSIPVTVGAPLRGAANTRSRTTSIAAEIRTAVTIAHICLFISIPPSKIGRITVSFTRAASDSSNPPMPHVDPETNPDTTRG
jgi:hypothetical protein